MDIVLTVTYFAILLGLGVIVANLLKKARIPDALFLILLGLVLGPTVFRNPAVAQTLNLTLVDVSVMGAVPDFLRILALILIVFIGASSVSFKLFKRFSNISLKLAIFGSLANTAFLGILANVIFGLELIPALLLASILSGTSTAIIYTYERVFTNSANVLNILKMESIFNSPLTVLLPLMFLGLLVAQPELFEPIKYVTQFWQLVAAGVGTGLIIGFAASRLLRTMLKEYSPLLLLAIALLAYALAENVGGSGMLAVAVAGLIVGNLSFPEKEQVRYFEDQLTELLRISVFTLLGAQVFITLDLYQIGLAVLFFAAIVLFRPLLLLPLLGRMKFDHHNLAVLAFVAPKGMVDAAIAPIVATALIGAGMPGMAGLIINIVFIVILLSIIFSTAAAHVLSRGGKPARTEEYEELKLPKRKKISKK